MVEIATGLVRRDGRRMSRAQGELADVIITAAVAMNAVADGSADEAAAHLERRLEVVTVLGEPDRDQLNAALSDAEERLGRPVQATIRDADWLDTGSGAFHDTVTGRPLLMLYLQRG